MLDNTPNERSKFRTKNLVEKNDDTRGKYNTNSQIKFKISLPKSCLCDYSDACTLVSGVAADDNAKRLDERNKGIMFKNCTPFTDCRNEINNTQIDNGKDLDVVRRTYNLIEFGDKYSRTLRGFKQYYKDNPNDNIVNSELFKFKINITGKTPAAGNAMDVKTTVPPKYLSNFWRTFLAMALINCEFNLI